MGIEANYRKYGEGALANYDYVDIANGLGYVELKGFTSSPAGVLTYNLDKNAMETGNTLPTLVDTHERRYTLINNGTSGAITFTTSAFNLPRIVKGKVYTNFTLVTSSTNTDTQIPTVTLYKNTDVLGSTSGAGTILSGDAINIAKTYNLSFNVSSTIIKRGDVLALKVSATSSGGNPRCWLEHDPLNRDVAQYVALTAGTHRAISAADNPTELNLFVPFKIDI